VLETTTRGDGPIGIASRRNVYRLDLVIGPADHRSTRVAELFAALARQKLEPGVISTSGERVSVIVAPGPGLDAAVAELGRKVRVERDLALLALIGRNVGGDTGLAARSVELFDEARVEIIESFVGSRQPSQVFIVPGADLERAVRALHAGLLRPVTARG
jgi:aspartokinase